MIDWNIQSRAHACQVCGRSFEHQDPYHTVLHEEKAGYARRDVCEACWTKASGEARVARAGFISHWQGVYEVPPPPTELIRRETAEGLLRKLVELQDPRYRAAMFILAVMLERKRLLKVKEQVQREGQRTIIYEQPKTGDLYAIADPQLELDQLETVQRDVARLLEHGLDAPVVPASDEPLPGEPTDRNAPEAGSAEVGTVSAPNPN